MSLQEEQRKRLSTIRALLTKAEHENTPPPEAEALSAKAAELMQKYCIDQAMLDAAAQVSKPKTVRERTVSFTGADFLNYRMTMLHNIALAHSCTTVAVGRAGAEPRSVIMGYESDIDLTEMLYTSLTLQAANALIAEDIPFGDSPRSFTTAWWAGYVDRICVRLYDMRRAAEAEARKANPGTAVVLRDRKSEVERFKQQEFPSTTPGSRTRGGRSRAGRAAGYRAGSAAKLTTPGGVSGGSASRAIGR